MEKINKYVRNWIENIQIAKYLLLWWIICIKDSYKDIF